jgi:hypothetical protein
MKQVIDRLDLGGPGGFFAGPWGRFDLLCIKAWNLDQEVPF